MKSRNQQKLEQINQAVKKYNQCLIYCEQQEKIWRSSAEKVIAAHPTFLKAYQLLALLYLHTAQYTKARQILKTARKLDTTNDITLRYMHELSLIGGQKTTKNPEKRVWSTSWAMRRSFSRHTEKESDRFQESNGRQYFCRGTDRSRNRLVSDRSFCR